MNIYAILIILCLIPPLWVVGGWIETAKKIAARRIAQELGDDQ